MTSLLCFGSKASCPRWWCHWQRSAPEPDETCRGAYSLSVFQNGSCVWACPFLYAHMWESLNSKKLKMLLAVLSWHIVYTSLHIHCLLSTPSQCMLPWLQSYNFKVTLHSHQPPYLHTLLPYPLQYAVPELPLKNNSFWKCTVIIYPFRFCIMIGLFCVQWKHPTEKKADENFGIMIKLWLYQHWVCTCMYVTFQLAMEGRHQVGSAYLPSLFFSWESCTVSCIHTHSG